MQSNLKQKVLQHLNENVFHSIGDKMDNGGSSFLKGLLAGGIGLAAFSDPETAHHVKEAISGTAHNIGNFLGLNHDNHGNDIGYGHENNLDQQGGALTKILNNNSINKNYNNFDFYINPNDPQSVQNFLNNYRKYVDNQAERWQNAADQFSPTHQIAQGVQSLVKEHPIATGLGAGLTAAGLGAAGYKLSKKLKTNTSNISNTSNTSNTPNVTNINK